jgi:hypothetical protein
VKAAKPLLILLLAYGAASLVHYAHNAEFLADYPNMPAWISRAKVYIAWFGVTTIGAVGYLLVRRGHQLSGLCVIAVYAAIGFDGLAHYRLAPLSAHTATMNLSIWLEVATAALLFSFAVGLAVNAASRGRRLSPPARSPPR